MSNAEMAKYLDMLSCKISSMYHVPKTYSEQLVNLSPMRNLLQEDAEYVAHMPLGSWAEMVYRSQHKA